MYAVFNGSSLLLCATAVSYEGHEVKKHCLNYILKNFERVSVTKGFEDLSKQPQLILEVTRESMSRQCYNK